ncbi:two-component sensor histidine kinase [Halalkalibacillus sediminis]|uniref:histidine kinase n=1 Tax=Halalkalibacillus sediminis TaxID=2018042 RepID=A0A2I0QR09_9BACI|nr:HAMP domain-containing sensor histidine kinase [Halalkalibacillus sediminis]PKR76759.1 two-component sensor histidine kinase [Halalkalibacillus sediminis]
MKTNNKKIPIQRYLTSRYLVTLFIGLIVVALISAWWIRSQTLENRLSMLEFMAEETASQLTGEDEQRIPPNSELRQFLDERGRFMNMDSDPALYIVNARGSILFSNFPAGQTNRQLSRSLLTNNDDRQLIETDSEEVYVVKKPVQVESTVLGWVVFVESKANLAQVNQEYRQLSIMLISLALIGAAVIYFLSRKISRPIKDVAGAAEQVKEGNYDIDLPENIKAEEIDELVRSFKEMSQKLKQLESLRTELLAGVTHELKTPVTSINGMIQALNDGVVEGEEAKEFLRISLNETEKMKRMVEDLLAFNSFAANAIPVEHRYHEVNDLIKECVREWEISNDEPGLDIQMFLLGQPTDVRVDDMRVQQILTNLLTNAKQAIKGEGKISLNLTEEKETIEVQVTDNGQGIPEEEQPFIFERFYRGENKKYQIGGLGLGLPFSKMISNVLGGDLKLKGSSSEGTTFQLTLPKD